MTTLALAALLSAACAYRTTANAQRAPDLVRLEDVRAELSALADDSMQGRGTGTAGSAKAARFLEAQLARFGVRPAGDAGGYFQRVPLAADNRGGVGLLPTMADLDTVPPARRLVGGNIVGLIPGSDSALRGEVVLVDAHYDHLGIGPPVAGDSIYNGADDDASGTVAVLEIARALARGPAPRRTVIVLATTGEEVGLLGTRWYIEHPARPLERTVANLEIEMIGRPDSSGGGAGHAWLTGFERSTMGATFAGEGLPIVADPHPEQQFFLRSDNIAFAHRGIPAHTLSSFNLHADYHTPRDELSRIDLAHVTRVIDAAVRAVHLLADGPAPRWNAGGRPEE